MAIEYAEAYAEALSARYTVRLDDSRVLVEALAQAPTKRRECQFADAVRDLLRGAQALRTGGMAEHDSEGCSVVQEADHVRVHVRPWGRDADWTVEGFDQARKTVEQILNDGGFAYTWHEHLHATVFKITSRAAGSKQLETLTDQEIDAELQAALGKSGSEQVLRTHIPDTFRQELLSRYAGRVKAAGIQGSYGVSIRRTLKRGNAVYLTNRDYEPAIPRGEVKLSAAQDRAVHYMRRNGGRLRMSEVPGVSRSVMRALEKAGLVTVEKHITTYLSDRGSRWWTAELTEEGWGDHPRAPQPPEPVTTVPEPRTKTEAPQPAAADVLPEKPPVPLDQTQQLTVYCDPATRAIYELGRRVTYRQLDGFLLHGTVTEIFLAPHTREPHVAFLCESRSIAPRKTDRDWQSRKVWKLEPPERVVVAIDKRLSVS
ncbi:hypothetical protein [Streptomyces sp. NPDC053048]|uniref:hypothetical protein n=1 Tax=Streptomyces sp. NPDC053048 TaxID=3365694 RepID=UPI0037D6FA93